MPNINLDNVEESTGAFEQLPPGAYVCVITRIEPHEDRQYWFCEWDVAEGQYAGFHKDSNFPPKDVMSYKESALGMLKHKLHVLTDDNEGFDAEAAFKADDLEAFRGKKFGAIIRKRLYTNANGDDREGIEIGRWVRTEEVRAGNLKELPPRDTRGVTATPAPTPAIQLADEDIPF